MIERITMTLLYLIISQTKRKKKTQTTKPRLLYTTAKLHRKCNSHIESCIVYFQRSSLTRLGIRFSNNTPNIVSQLPLSTHSPTIHDPFSWKCKSLRPKCKAPLAESSKSPLEKLRTFPPNHPAIARSLAGWLLY